MRVQQKFTLVNLLHRQFDHTGYTIILPHGTHHGTSAAPTSILIESVMITSAISNKPTWDRARSADTVRVGLPSAYSVWALQLYIPLGRWFSVTPASMDLFSIPMALCIHAPTACQCACNKHSRPQTCCTVGLQHNMPHGTHHGTSAAPTSILIKLVLMPSAISIKPTWRNSSRSVGVVGVGVPSAYSTISCFCNEL